MLDDGITSTFNLHHHPRPVLDLGRCYYKLIIYIYIIYNYYKPQNTKLAITWVCLAPKWQSSKKLALLLGGCKPTYYWAEIQSSNK